MIQQRPGDLLEIEYEGRFYYVVVLTNIVLFGGNILFAFHTDGTRKSLQEIQSLSSGFNICSDLLMPKKEGVVSRMERLSDTEKFWKTRFVKASTEKRVGIKSPWWYISKILPDGTEEELKRYRRLPRRFRKAMDSGCYSFDLVASKILAGYTPEQNSNI